MRVAWPYCPRTPVTDVLQWQTDVLRTKATEQRIGLRTRPRRTLVFSHHLTPHQYAEVLAIIEANQAGDAFYVPDWTQARRVGSLTAGSGVQLISDTSGLHYGDSALVWASERQYEVVSVTEDSATISADTLADSYDNAFVMPAFEGDLDGPVEASRYPTYIEASANFTLTEAFDLGDSKEEQYRSLDVLDVCPVVGGGAFSEGVDYPVSSLGSVGLDKWFRSRDVTDRTYQMRWHLFDDADIFALVEWLHSRRGRLKAFWLPTFAKDYLPAAGVSGTTLTVYADQSTLPSAPFDIELVGGSTYRRRVSAVSAGTPVAGRSTLDLTLDSGITESLGSIQRISRLYCSRLDADRIEVEHAASAGAVVSVPVREVPEP